MTATEATAQPHRSFFGYMIYRLTRPWPWVGILILAGIKFFWEEYKAKSTPRPTIEPQHSWLAEGRKAAGLD